MQAERRQARLRDEGELEDLSCGLLSLRLVLEAAEAGRALHHTEGGDHSVQERFRTDRTPELREQLQQEQLPTEHADERPLPVHHRTAGAGLRRSRLEPDGAQLRLQQPHELRLELEQLQLDLAEFEFELELRRLRRFGRRLTSTAAPSSGRSERTPGQSWSGDRR